MRQHTSINNAKMKLKLSLYKNKHQTIAHKNSQAQDPYTHHQPLSVYNKKKQQIIQAQFSFKNKKENDRHLKSS